MEKAPCQSCGSTDYTESHSFIHKGEVATVCDDCYCGRSTTVASPVAQNRIGKRALHWGDIKTRVTTHEGEVLSGKAGRDYQVKWSKKYLGRDLSAPVTISEDQVRAYEGRRSRSH